MVLTVPEAARFLRVSEDVVYRLCASGEIPARRVGRQWRGTGWTGDSDPTTRPEPRPVPQG